MAIPSVLAFTRSINPGHLLMYSANKLGAPIADLTPLSVREEPLRGLNATSKTKEEEKSKAVLQVVESSELAAGNSVLVLLGKVLARHEMGVPHSCNEKDFFDKHAALIAVARDAGDFKELARRYAVTMAIGGWAWRNLMEAQDVLVSVAWEGENGREDAVFVDLLPAATDMFDFASREYVEHRPALEKLASALERALSTPSERGINFSLRADLTMGLGARVYPSQEWASTEMQKASVQNWKGGNGVTRTLAKLKTPAGYTQAIINDRKVGNALRVIDTWYPNAPANCPIAVEPYGANSHQGVAFRSAPSTSVFGVVDAITLDKPVSSEQRLFYLAACIRGGVFGA
jgi:CRISPR-associated protein Csy3